MEIKKKIKKEFLGPGCRPCGCSMPAGYRVLLVVHGRFHARKLNMPISTPKVEYRHIFMNFSLLFNCINNWPWPLLMLGNR